MKICTKCGIEKAKGEFHKQTKCRDGLRTACKACGKVYGAARRATPEGKAATAAMNANPDKKLKKAAWAASPRGKAYMAEYNAVRNAEPEYKAYKAAHNSMHNNAYITTRRVSDQQFRLILNIRSLTANAFRRNGFKKSGKTAQILGCSWEHFQQHLESQFLDGMLWENQGSYWHIDHWIPISSARTEAEVIKLSHYSNLRPLRADLNLLKRNHIPYTISPSEKPNIYIIHPYLEQDGDYILYRLNRYKTKLRETVMVENKEILLASSHIDTDGDAV